MSSTVERPSTSAIVDRVEALFVANVDAVYNVAYRILWDRTDTEDVVQRTFLKALTRLSQLRDPDRVRPWLLQIASREAITTLRARRETPTAPEELPDGPLTRPGPEEMAVASDVVRLLNGLLASMDTRERDAVVLRDVEQLKMTEVAEALDIGLSAAKMRVHRGRATLRRLVSAGACGDAPDHWPVSHGSAQEPGPEVLSHSDSIASLPSWPADRATTRWSASRYTA